MANQRIDIDVGLKVDKTGLNQIKSSLQEIKNLTAQDLMKIGGHTDIQKAEQELKNLKTSISQIDGALEKAFNTDLGTLNVSKFNQALKGMNLNQVYKDFSAAGAAGQAAFRNVTSQILTTNMQLKQTHNFLNNMATTMANTVKWGVASSVMNNFTGSVQKAYGYVKSLDTSLNDIRIVTNKSAEEMDKFAVKANNAAKALGKSTTDYTNASLIYYQQGLSDKDVAARAETTLKAANVTGQSGEDVSEQLTAVWNGYKVSAEEAELYIDKLAAVAATTASDLEELSTGMSKVASAANLMGVDIDSLNAQMATIVSVTRQAPESVGTALKTIYARMGDIEAGLDAETTLGNYTEEMKAMGVNVLDTSGKLRDMGDVINEIGGNWKNMTREQQLSLSQTMAGTRQYNNLLSLFDNWDMYTKALETSANAAGTLQQQQDTYMESTQAHLNQLRAASEDLYDSLLDNDTVNNVADGLTFVVKRFTDLVDGIGGGGNALLSLGSIATRVFSQQIAQGLATTIKNFQGVKYNAQQVSAQFELLRQFKDLSIGDKALTDIIGWKEQIMQLGSIVTAEENNQANAIMKTRIELENEADAWERKKKVAESYLGKTDIAQKPITGISEQESQSIISSLDTQIKKYGNVIEGAKRYSDSISNLKNVITDTSSSTEDYKDALADTKAKMETLKSSSGDMLKTLNQQSVEYNELRNAIKEYNLALKSDDGEKIQVAAEKMVNAYKNAARRMQQEAKNTKTVVEQETNGTTENFKKKIGEAQQTWSQFINQLNSTKKIQSIVNIVGAVGQLVSVINTLSNIKDIINDESLTGAEKTLKIISALTMAIPMLSMALKTLKTDIGTLLVLTKLTTDAQLQEVGVSGALKAAWIAEDGALKSLVTTLGIYALALAAVAGTVYLIIKAHNKEKDALEEANKAVQNQTAELERLKTAQEEVNRSLEAYENAAEKVKTLTEGTQEWRDAINEANSAALKLLDKYPELASEIKNVNGELQISEDGLKDFAQAAEAEFNRAQSDLYLTKAEQLEAQNAYSAVEAGRNIQYQVGNQQFTVADETINQVVEKINESGSGFLKDAESIQKELGITNENLAEALASHHEPLEKLATEVAANTAALQIYNSQALKGYLSDEDYLNASDEDKALIEQILGPQFSELQNQLYEDKYKDTGLTSQLDDATIQKLYAEQIGAEASKNKGKNVGEYLIDGEWKTISDNTARLALAAAEAAGELDGLSKGVIEASSSLDQMNIGEDIKSAILGFSSGQTADLSGMSFDQLAQLDNTTITDEIASSLGYKGKNPAKQYMEAIDIAISNELENRTAKLQEEISNAPDTIAQNLSGVMNLTELEKFNSAGGIDMSAIDPEMFNTMLAEGLSLEEVFNEIDWNSIDPSKPTEWFKNAFEQAINDADYSKDNEQDVEANYSADAEKYEIDEETYRNTTELIQEMAEESEDLEKALKNQEDTAQEVAKDLLRYDKAVESVKENSEDWLKALKSGNLQDIGESMEDITDAYGNMLDIDGSMLSEDFLTSAENMEDLQAAANGSEEAYNRLAEAARQDMAAKIGFDDTDFQNKFNSLMEQVGNPPLDEMKIGADLDTGNFLNGLSEMVNAAGMKAEEATNYLSSMGIDAEVETDTVTAPETSTVIKGYRPRLSWGSHNVSLGPLGDFDMKVPQLEFDTITDTVKTDKQIAANALRVTSAKKSSGGGFKHKNSSHGSGSKGGKKSSGGGGGGGGGKAKSEKKISEKKDRYHDVNVKLKQIDKELEDIGRDQEKYFGKDLIKALNKELDILEKQKKVYKEKLDIVKQEQKELQKSLKSDGVKFNSDGTISNYEKALQAQEDALNKLIDKYNKLPASKQEKFKETVLDPAKEEFEKFKENIERYDELLLDEIPEIEDSLQKIADREIEINVQKLKMEVEIRLDLSEAEKDWNEFQREVIDGIDSDDILGNAQSDKNLYETLLGNGTLEGETNKIKNIMKAINDINTKGSSEIYGNNKQLAMDDLKEAMDEIMGSMTDLNDLKKNIDEAYLDMIDEMGDAFDNQTESLEYVNELLEHNVNLTELLHGEDAYAEMAKHYQDIKANNLEILASQRAAADYYKKMMETETDPEAAEKWKEKWKAVTEEINSTVEKSLEDLNAEYINSIDLAFSKIQEKFASLAGDKKYSYYTLEWELAKEDDDNYLSALDKTYELQKLNNKYQKSINDTTSTKAQKELNKLRDEELKKLREKDKLTQYDIDRANARYELKLKEIALEEAQQNKSQMRLRRDSSGNYSYQFVADEDSISKAQEDVLDATHSSREMDEAEQRRINDRMIELEEEYKAKLKEIDINDTEAKELLEKEYLENMAALQADYLAVTQNLKESVFMEMALLYDQDISYYQEMSDAEQDILMNQMVPTWDTGMHRMMEAMAGSEGLLPVCKQAFQDLKEATDTYNDSLVATEETAGRTFDSTKTEYTENIALAKDLVEEAKNLVTETQNELTAVNDLKEGVDTLATSYETVYKNATDALTAAQNLWKAEQEHAAEEAKKNNPDPDGDGDKTTTTEGKKDDNEGKTSTSEPTKEDKTLKKGDRVTYESGKYYYTSAGDSPTGTKKRGKKVYVTKIKKGAKYPIHISTGSSLGNGDLGWLKEKQLKFDTGGYTGDWAGNDGKTAILHKKELVLNAKDTENVLATVNIVRDMQSMIDSLNNSILSRTNGFMDSINASLGFDTNLGTDLNQQVSIQASFPNVSSRMEIEQAFENLVNLASQHAFDTRR